MVDKRNIAIIFSNNNNFFQNPHSIELINKLKENSYSVLFCLEKQNFGIPESYKKNNFIFLNDIYIPNFILINGIKNLLSKILFKSKFKTIEGFLYIFKDFSLNIYDLCKIIFHNIYLSFKIFFTSLPFNKRIILGIDEYGYLMTHDLMLFNQFSNKVFVSHELYFDDEINDQLLEIKNQAHKKIYGCKYIISTCRERLQVLVNSSSYKNSFINKRFFCIPVSYSSKMCPNNIVKKLSGNLIYTGTISKACRTFELIKLFAESHELSSYNLYFNSYHKFEIKKSPKNVFFLNNPIPEIKDYISYISTFDIGLVLYYPDINIGPHFGKNIEFIGLSSGKFSLFAMLGIPIICSPNYSYIELFKQYKFGCVIEDLNKIPQSIKTIYEDYDFFSSECKRLYWDILEPSRKLNEFSFYL